MICPHCHQTIPEQSRYLMSRGDKLVWTPSLRMGAGLILFFLFLIAIFSLRP